MLVRLQRARGLARGHALPPFFFACPSLTHAPTLTRTHTQRTRSHARAEFTYSHASVLDGQTWRVSLSEEEGDAQLTRDGFPLQRGGGGGAEGAGARVNLSGSTASSARSGSEEVGSEGGAGPAEERQ